MINHKPHNNQEPKQTALQRLTSICDDIDSSLNELVGCSILGTFKETKTQVDLHCAEVQKLIRLVRELNDKQTLKLRSA